MVLCEPTDRITGLGCDPTHDSTLHADDARGHGRPLTNRMAVYIHRSRPTSHLPSLVGMVALAKSASQKTQSNVYDNYKHASLCGDRLCDLSSQSSSSRIASAVIVCLLYSLTCAAVEL